MMNRSRFNAKKIGTLLLVTAALFFLFFESPARAHRVNVFAWVEGETVHTEAGFSGGKEVRGGQIVVYDDTTDEKLLEGTTDDRGKFSFPVPRRTSLRIELTAGMGHRNEWIVPAEEIAAAGGAPGPATSFEKTGAAPERPMPAPAADAPSLESRIEAAVEKALDRKLAPLQKMAAESRRRPTTVADVVGGVGYIVGLAGLGAYLHYRRKIKELESR